MIFSLRLNPDCSVDKQMNFKSYSSILTGTVIAQLINLGSLLIFTRIYGPSDFGFYQIYFSAFNVLLMVACYRYEVALLNVREGPELNILIRLILCLCLANAVILGICVIFFGDFFAVKFKIPMVMLYILPFALVVGGAYQASIYLPIRDRRYSLAGAHKVSQASGFFLAGLVLASFSISNFGLIIADIFGRIFGFVRILLSYARSTEGLLGNWKSIETKKYLECAKANIDSLTLIFPGTLMSSLVPLLLPLFLVNQYSIEILGQYSLVERFLIAPCAILSAAISQVITGDFSAQVRAKSFGLQRQYRKLVAFLVAMSSLVAVFCWFFIPTIFYFFFGEEWLVAGNLAKYSILYVATTLVVAPMSMLLVVSGRRWHQLMWEVMRFIFMVGFFHMLNFYFSVSVEFALLLLGMAVAFCYVIFLIIVDQAMAGIDRMHAS